MLPLCGSISRCSPQRLSVRRFHRGERLSMALFHLLDSRLQITRHRRLGRCDCCLLRASRFARSRLLARRGRRLRLASRGRGRRPCRRVLCASRTLIGMQKSLCMLTGQRIKRRRLVCRCRLSGCRELRRRRLDGVLPLLVRRLEQKRLGILRCVERGNALVGGLLGRSVERRGDLVLVLAQQRIAHRVRLVSRPAQRLRPLCRSFTQRSLELLDMASLERSALLCRLRFHGLARRGLRLRPGLRHLGGLRLDCGACGGLLMGSMLAEHLGRALHRELVGRLEGAATLALGVELGDGLHQLPPLVCARCCKLRLRSGEHALPGAACGGCDAMEEERRVLGTRDEASR